MTLFQKSTLIQGLYYAIKELQKDKTYKNGICLLLREYITFKNSNRVIHKGFIVHEEDYNLSYVIQNKFLSYKPSTTQIPKFQIFKNHPAYTGRQYWWEKYNKQGNKQRILFCKTLIKHLKTIK